MLKSIRIKQGLTQQALADLSKINIRLIQKYESGEYLIENMTIKNAISLLDVLGIADIRELLEKPHDDDKGG